MKLYRLIGRIAYTLLKPLIGFFASRTARTRVIIRHGDDILVMKNWLSDGEWALPGGGLERHEGPVDGVIRETHEELRVKLNPTELKLLFDDMVTYDQFTRFRTIVYEYVVVQKMPVSPRTIEVNNVEWKSITALASLPKIGLLLRKVYSGQIE